MSDLQADRLGDPFTSATSKVSATGLPRPSAMRFSRGRSLFKLSWACGTLGSGVGAIVENQPKRKRIEDVRIPAVKGLSDDL